MNAGPQSKEKRMGSSTLAEDIMRRLEQLGIKRNDKYATMYDALDGVVALAEQKDQRIKALEKELAERDANWLQTVFDQIGHITDLDAKIFAKLEAESAELMERNNVMMSLLREFYDNGYSQAKCWDVICKHGGDA